MFRAECYRPTRDDATLAPVAMLSAPFLDMFPSVCVCHFHSQTPLDTELWQWLLWKVRNTRTNHFNWSASNGKWQSSLNVIVPPSWAWAVKWGKDSRIAQIHYPQWLRRTSSLGTMASLGSESCPVVRLWSIPYLGLCHRFSLPHPNHNWLPHLTAFGDGA